MDNFVQVLQFMYPCIFNKFIIYATYKRLWQIKNESVHPISFNIKKKAPTLIQALSEVAGKHRCTSLRSAPSRELQS